MTSPPVARSPLPPRSAPAPSGSKHPPRSSEAAEAMAKREDYVYLPLADARKAVGVKVNLFAAVAEIGGASRSKGTDYFLKLRITDESNVAPGLSVIFFAENTSKLPHVKSSGDILCLHRVVTNIHNGDVYCTFRKKFSSFALFEGKGSLTFSPYQASQNFHGREHDVDFIKRLRTWLRDHQLDSGAKDYTLQLREIEVGLEFDLICKVLHACEICKDVWMLFLWDGTDTPPIAFETNMDAEGEDPSPLHLESSSLTVDVLRLFPCVGSILRIAVGKYFKEIEQLVGGGNWVKFRRITCAIQSGIWKGILINSSKVCMLFDGDEAVILRERNYTERIRSNCQRRPLSCIPRPSCVTEIDYEDLVDSTLMDSLTYPEVTHKCKCIVRVVAACPWRAKDLYSSTERQYRLRLTLEDPTARIHAYICGEDGVKFFGDDQSNENMTRKMNKLLGIAGDGVTAEGNCVTRNPPWVYCCLKSFYADERNPWQSRKYRIFGTKLVGCR